MTDEALLSAATSAWAEATGARVNRQLRSRCRGRIPAAVRTTNFALGELVSLARARLLEDEPLRVVVSGPDQRAGREEHPGGLFSDP